MICLRGEVGARGRVFGMVAGHASCAASGRASRRASDVLQGFMGSRYSQSLASTGPGINRFLNYRSRANLKLQTVKGIQHPSSLCMAFLSSPA